MILQLFNMSLRLGALALKMVLMLYMGKYLGLTEMGTYGLVTAYVTIFIPLMGVRLDYVVSRDIVGMEDLPLARRLRDQSVFYGFNYLVLILLGGLIYAGMRESVDPAFLFFTLALAILESVAAVSAGNLVSRHRPILANALFFTRSALWVLPVVALGYFQPEFRTANTVFMFWLTGILISLIVTMFVWRKLPWKEAVALPVDWAWMKSSLRRTLPIWLGAVSAAAATNIDRFVVELNLGRDFVGINSFYGSFVVAMSALLNSGIFAFGTPHLIALHRDGKTEDFLNMARKMTVQAALSGALLAILFGAAIPQLGYLIGRPEFAEQAETLWLMLAAAWLRYSAEGLYLVMYARHQDRQIWIGNFMLIIPAVLFNLALVPILGFVGIGVSAVLTTLILCLWRIYCVRHPEFSTMETESVKD